MKKIAHWGGYGRNFGDLLMLQQQRRMLQAQSEEELLFVPLSSHTRPNGSIPEIGEAELELINSCDMLMIGAGGQIMLDENREGKWQFNIKKENINKIKVPLVLYGIGINLFPHCNEDSHSQQVMDNHIAAVATKAELISVRDSYAEKYIKRLNTGVPIELIADPAYGIFEIMKSTYSYNPHVKTIGLVWGGDRQIGRFGSLKSCINSMIALADKIKSYPWENYEVIYIPHTELWDRVDAVIFEQLFPKGKFRSLVPDVLPESENKLACLLSWYSQCDLVISSRWHGNIIAEALEIPSIPYGDMLKQQALCSDTFNAYLKNDCSNFSDCVTEVEAKKDCNTLLDKETLLDNLKDFNKKVLEIL